MVWLLILISYVPMLTLFAFMDRPRTYMYAVAGFWVFIFLLLKLPTVSFLSLKKSQSKIIRLFVFFCLNIIVFWSIYNYLGFQFNFDLLRVYEDIRPRYVAARIPLAGYLFNWLCLIVNPIFFAMCIKQKKWIYAVFIAFLQFLVFSVTGMKYFFFALPFVSALMWIISRKNPLAWMMVGLIGVILTGVFSFWLIDDRLISSFFIRRPLFVPAQLSFFYYDFFSTHNHVVLSHSIFRFFLDYPYHLGSGYLIGETYFGNSKTNAVTGIVGDAYMNFGFVGLVLWSILLVIILRLIDSFSKNKDAKITVATIAMPAITITNSALLTNLLTHGLLLALVLLYLLPKRKISNI